MKLIIDRNFLTRNTLYDSISNKKCIMGFYLSSLGVQDHEIEPYELISTLENKKISIPFWLVKKTNSGTTTVSDLVCEIMTANDIIKDQEEREKKIIELFSLVDVFVTFVN